MESRTIAWSRALLLPLLLLLPAAASGEGAWSLPEPGSCEPKGGLVSAGRSDPDAVTVPFKTGDVFAMDRAQVLKDFLPEFIWPYRERFFFDGMRLEIGPCFADYSWPAFYTETTEKFRGQAQITEENGLESYTVGQPFPRDTLSMEDPKAGDKWLWNVEMRYQAAGYRGDFRITDLVGRIGRAEPFEGELFKLHVSHRADRPEEDYQAPGAKGRQFVAGGLFTRPFDARENSWRQFRDVKQYTDARRSDELHAWIPGLRRVRRLNSVRTEGLYMPGFSVGVVPTQQLPGGVGGDGAGFGGGSAGTAGGAIGGTIQTKRSGYEGLVWKPGWHVTKVLGLHDVLTPINSVVPGYPENAERDFGPWGLSWASDRWDLRRALVLELFMKEDEQRPDVARQVLYVDLQTLTPLYLATFDKDDEITNVGYFVGRWSETREDYPRWPDDPERPIRVIDPVGAAFANLHEGGSWRRESWENVSTPPKDRTVKRMLSVNQLSKRR